MFKTYSRSDLFKRAWNLKRRNPHWDFGKLLKMAWGELKTGDTMFWGDEGRIYILRTEIARIENKTILRRSDYRELESLRVRLNDLLAA